jgi:hypothetical protein
MELVTSLSHIGHIVKVNHATWYLRESEMNVVWNYVTLLKFSSLDLGLPHEQPLGPMIGAAVGDADDADDIEADELFENSGENSGESSGENSGENSGEEEIHEDQEELDSDHEEVDTDEEDETEENIFDNEMATYNTDKKAYDTKIAGIVIVSNQLITFLKQMGKGAVNSKKKTNGLTVQVAGGSTALKKLRKLFQQWHDGLVKVCRPDGKDTIYTTALIKQCYEEAASHVRNVKGGIIDVFKHEFHNDKLKLTVQDRKSVV